MKKLTISVKFINNAILSMKSFILSIAMLSIIVKLSGCAGSMMNSLGKSMSTGKTYGEMRATRPKLEDGKGRLNVYRTKASTNTSLEIGNGLQKNPTFVTVDDTAYKLI